MELKILNQAVELVNRSHSFYGFVERQAQATGMDEKKAGALKSNAAALRESAEQMLKSVVNG